MPGSKLESELGHPRSCVIIVCNTRAAMVVSAPHAKCSSSWVAGRATAVQNSCRSICQAHSAAKQLPCQHPYRPLSCAVQRKEGLSTRQRLQPPKAGALDVMPEWTLDQIAGLAFGAVMLAAVLGAKQVDVFFAKAQRRQLGLCEECGGTFQPDTCPMARCPSKAVPKS
ncbi:hypothetical protein V8C86DRAFT_2476535 [Haematococcus lacustris]